jgi:thiol-disulfide isomerase/thioredoxin
MATFLRYILLIAGITIGLASSFGQGYEIKIKIPVLKDSMVLLGHHFNNDKLFYPDDTVHLDKKGQGVFKKKKNLPGGMYWVYLPNKKYFDILLSDNQVFAIEVVDTSDMMKGIKITGSNENKLFFDYRAMINEKGDQANKLMEKKKNAGSPQQKDSLSKAIDKLHQEVLGFVKKVKTENPRFFLTTLLNSFEDVQVPDPPRDANGHITDSTFQYRYYRTHYFDNFDLNDPRLLRTIFYEQKLKTYIDKVVPQIPDTLNYEIDRLLTKVHGNDEIFRVVLVTLFNQYAGSQIMGQDAVLVHVAEKWYIPYSTWNDKKFIDNLKKELAKVKPNLIGSLAPDLKLVEVPSDHFMVAKTDTALKSNPYVGNNITLHTIKAKYLVVAFWEADCGHCKKAIPELYNVYQKVKDKGVQVLAIHMISSIEGKRKWIDFVNEHGEYDWMNAWSPYNYDYKDLYNVYTTPVIYILDENKKIIAKKISPDQVEEIIKFEESRKVGK